MDFYQKYIGNRRAPCVAARERALEGGKLQRDITRTGDYVDSEPGWRGVVVVAVVRTVGRGIPNHDGASRAEEPPSSIIITAGRIILCGQPMHSRAD